MVSDGIDVEQLLRAAGRRARERILREHEIRTWSRLTTPATPFGLGARLLEIEGVQAVNVRDGVIPSLEVEHWGGSTLDVCRKMRDLVQPGSGLRVDVDSQPRSWSLRWFGVIRKPEVGTTVSWPGLLERWAVTRWIPEQLRQAAERFGFNKGRRGSSWRLG